MNEIGGYLELENFSGEEYYPELLKLNLGRTALLFALDYLKIKKLWLPYFLCDSITSICADAPVSLEWYHINAEFEPILPEEEVKDGEYVYLVNYYGQISDQKLLSYQRRYKNIFLDNTHAFFQRPQPGIPVLYSCRKFFGLPDGAYLYLDDVTEDILSTYPVDISSFRMSHILGRYEHSASEYYANMLETASHYYEEPIKRMSHLTENLLKGIDYSAVRKKRTENYEVLASALNQYNPLSLLHLDGPFVYPFYCTDGINIRKKLAAEKIFIPTYWSNVIDQMPKETLEYDYAANILPLPCDQRYSKEHMEYILQVLRQIMKGPNNV
ncbi:hypothetical protein AALH30_05720 [Blautia pseudococcoides]|uniref:hypothetical protein n=1 Tax=Blautia pseudococcoides TaxID=1796616 RepID=UPI00148AF93C|nr:hypothetical protein [Blautia pseudococcoides]QJU15245.1 hypothetical protein HL650_12740 [Blautia pseudococcoides]